MPARAKRRGACVPRRRSCRKPACRSAPTRPRSLPCWCAVPGKTLHRDRHVHRLQRAGDRRGAAEGRPPGLLRHQRGVDFDRAPPLERGRRLRTHRPAHRAGARHAEEPARPRRSRQLRLRLHRRRQIRLRRLLRSLPELLKPGGLIALDNMLWSGRVVDPDHHDTDTDAIRALNAKIRNDARVESVC